MKKEESALIPSLKLFIICLVVALGLSMLNYITEPVITKANEQKKQVAMGEVLENCTFNPLNENVYEGKNGDETVGYAVSVVSPIGYGGDIELIVGFDKEFNVKGVSFIKMSETKGIGTKTKDDPAFIAQFIGKSVPSENDFQCITGATVSSKAVRYGIELALDMAKEATTK